MRRKIKGNFRPGDLWCTLLYPRGTRISIEDVQKDVQKFLRNLRGRWQRRGSPLKYIYRIEIGSRGGTHVHLLVNRIRDADRMVQDCWTPGRVHFEGITEEVKDLAEYIVKKPQEKVMELLEGLPPEERKAYIRYSCSRNLVEPKPERKKYMHWTMRKLLEKGPTPEPGFYIVKDSIVQGVNPFTGMSYLQYEERRIRTKGRGQGGGSGGGSG